MNPTLVFVHTRRTSFALVTLFTAWWQVHALAQDRFAPKPAVPSGFILVEGDVLVPMNSHKSPFSNELFNYWPDGIVHFEWDDNVSFANRTAMLNAMFEWEQVANVRFVLRNGELDYAHIQNSTGNSSQIGRYGGGQTINITSWGSRFIMAHELGHCLAFGHTQSRSDRDLYVTINYGNIQGGFGNQFDVAAGFRDYGPYDFDSVMQYGQCAFSIDCNPGSTCACTNHVIDVRPPYDTYWQSRIGQRTHLSNFDKLIMSFLYPQPTWVFLDGSNTGLEFGTFLRPYKTYANADPGVPSGGTLWIQPGSYSAPGRHSKPMTFKAPLGGVVLRN